MTELIFPLINALLVIYLVYRMRGATNGSDRSAKNNDLPAWAEQQLEDLKTRIQRLENDLDASQKSQQEVLLNAATEKATLEGALEAAKEKLAHVEKMHEAQKLEEENRILKDDKKHERPPRAQTHSSPQRRMRRS